ncbi:hypothetical protein [Eoetvoesiella caeni]|uniref:DUF4365 domain-containing protein n=1 Tax=Eoetvoesiella caeni TaxID=645616 RepID=A0A366GZY6_9BURK|nr:hypothetical protein [Eoetvoesiella caeni]MCI2811190.1 hypothetical protein [Eoetvoesiella caeni]RBP35003.1 hypothetical protein DFR37_1224 [Eoetvoesiella caeni]
MNDEPRKRSEGRLDTRLESEGAEFLVLGQLLIHRIAAYKTYTNMPGYDLVATDPEHNRSARIQVKSRWSTGARAFLIQNLDCDFVVVVLLNRGSKDGNKQVMAPHYYVLPIEIVRSLPRTVGWKKVSLRHIDGLEQYRDAWHLVSSFMSTHQRIGVAKRRFDALNEIHDEDITRLFYGSEDSQR